MSPLFSSILGCLSRPTVPYFLLVEILGRVISLDERIQGSLDRGQAWKTNLRRQRVRRPALRHCPAKGLVTLTRIRANR